MKRAPSWRQARSSNRKSGTLLTLGNCSERVGLTATAWAQYKEAAALARKEERSDYAEKATELASKLEPKLSKLRIDAQINQGGVELTVELDGKTVLSGTFGVAFAIDPGDHVVTARAPGRDTWTTKVTIGPVADTKIVAVPQLAAETHQLPPRPTPAQPGPKAAPAGHDFSHAPRAGIPVWAWIAGGLGLAATGASIAFAVDQAGAASALDAIVVAQSGTGAPQTTTSPPIARARSGTLVSSSVLASPGSRASALASSNRPRHDRFERGRQPRPGWSAQVLREWPRG